MAKKRRRDRDFPQSHSRQEPHYPAERSLLARLNRQAVVSPVKQISRVNSMVRRVALRPVRRVDNRRLRTGIAIARDFVGLTMHRNVREVERCIKSTLHDYQQRKGSGAGRRRVSRQESRRRMFAAARRAC